ncbi:MAG TPA: tRNA (adenosine(37)-N6)-threonylcarbamoyltransferase complex transferase subunit TsaD [Candidatus Andersenbacteria bacterium]|nr:tRNA (adenosine(37)-N6)-threonylcarbamoyltransferase complex transferase subunit TsaD [Candidatus Andersenbacteria bacterium]
MDVRKTTILAIESSCDDTGVAVVQKNGENIDVLASLVTSQDIHAATGGVIPEAAAREHVRVISPMVKTVMEKSGLNKDDINAIALTVGPGLMPSLAVGVQAARTLAYAWNKPIVPVHHIEGHIYSALLASPPYEGGAGGGLLSGERNLFPALAVIISGGHTMLIRVQDHLNYEVLGQTRDDAIGEVFDKVARMLGLGYPGGAKVSKLAEQGNPNAFHFPRPMEHSHDLDFSYSGLKTAVLYQLRDLGENVTEKDNANIAASFQEAICDSVVTKIEYALKKDAYKSILFAGGVAANTALRIRIAGIAEEQGIELRIAPPELCGDNAVMIGEVGVYAFEAGRIKNWGDVDAVARVSIETFSK